MNLIYMDEEIIILNYLINYVTLILLTWTIWRAPTNASKWRMGFNTTFKGLNCFKHSLPTVTHSYLMMTLGG